MLTSFESFTVTNTDAIDSLFRHYQATGKKLLLGGDLWDGFEQFTKENKHITFSSRVPEVLKKSQEAAINHDHLYLMVRPRVASWQYFHYSFNDKLMKRVEAEEFLAFKERLVAHNPENRMLEIDFAPFERDFPKMNQTRSIGNGVDFLNRQFSSRLAQDLIHNEAPLLSFLSLHGYEGQTFLINASIKSVKELQAALQQAMEYLKQQQPVNQWHEVEATLRLFGFEPGWGRTVKDISSTMSLLANLLEAPDYQNLEEFLARIPMIFNVVILSPHGFFGQKNVLGLPDTGGQIVYILDQVRALEKEMKHRLYKQGLDIKPKIIIVTRLIPEAGDTTCNQPEELVTGTDHVTIVRIPFRRDDGSIINQWISRFEVWPYLESFAFDAEKEILKRFKRTPDLIIGNYSDGNLVAYLLSQSLGVTQCTIAHALEKTKYLYSGLYWKDMEEQYHFSCQFTADMIAMNSSDFIITSTYQEIAGSDDIVGQYESYGTFTMPDLQRVLHGIDIFDPKFNIVSPGADDETYFPYTDTDRRNLDLLPEIEAMIFGETDADSRGMITHQDRPIIFSMARLDTIKNLTGLVQWFGAHPKLREQASLVIIGGTVSPEKSSDNEERKQIDTMHHLFEHYQLDGYARWIGKRLDKRVSGELYRFIADKRGCFIQPAFFEAFGLTVIEAMASGLPTFATKYGGPLEIIENGISGFHIDPNRGEESAEKFSHFLKRCTLEPDYWRLISEGAIERVESRYTWKRYAKRLLSLTCVYGFWKFATNLERQETGRYLEMLYHLQFKHRANLLRGRH